jgi:outer membrane protein assembly factor BamB
MRALYMTVHRALGRSRPAVANGRAPRGEIRRARRDSAFAVRAAALSSLFVVGLGLAACGSAATPAPSRLPASPSPTPSPAPSYPVRFTVVDAYSHRPIPDVRLRVTTLEQTVTTDVQGTTTAAAHAPGQRLRVVPTKQGYSTYPVRVRADGEGRVTIALFPADAQWSTYGQNATRTRSSAGLRLGPPGKLLWKTGRQGLLEFPATLAYDLVFYNGPYNYMYARSLADGKLVWKHRAPGAQFASQPTVSERTVYFSIMNGSVRAFDCFTGRPIWTRRGLGPVESSPLVVGDLLYVGDWYGNVYALDKTTGHTVWRRNLGAKITSSAAYADGRIYIGRYYGAAYALNAKTGSVRWQAGGAGDFYGTPAVADGRVVFPSSDGRAVYCFSASSGRLLWSHSLGYYVYSSPAISRGTVYLGSYTGTFYAFDLTSGALRWSFSTGSAISGAPSVVGGIVYFSNFAGRTYGLDTRTGKLRWRFADGRYSPVTATRGAIVVAGSSRLYAFKPRAG